MSVPILRLRLAGYCGIVTNGLTCGATSGEIGEKKALQDAACSLQAVPILWYRKVREKNRQIIIKQEKRVKGLLRSPTRSPTSVAGNQNQNDDLFKLQRRKTGLNHVTALFETADKNGKGIEQIEEEVEDDDLCYAGVEAVMSVRDSEDGPVLEIRAHGLQFSLFQNSYEIVDLDPKYDVISSFLLEGNKKGQDFLERTIPLNLISHASPGGYWDWKNMLNFTSGNCDCAVKVYSRKFSIPRVPKDALLVYNYLQLKLLFCLGPPDDVLILAGKKLLLFDVLNRASIKSGILGEVDRDKLIDSLNILLVWNKNQMTTNSQVLDKDGKKKKSWENAIEEFVHNTLCC